MGSRPKMLKRFPAMFATLLLCISGGGAASYDCSKKYCRDMSSCAEARYQHSVCGYSNLDGDNDGIPCENVCGSGASRQAAPSGPARPSVLNQQNFNSLMEMAPQGRAEDRDATEARAAAEGASFSCAGKRRCGQMSTCAEAKFYLHTCGVRSLDRDGDGVPCETLCAGR